MLLVVAALVPCAALVIHTMYSQSVSEAKEARTEAFERADALASGLEQQQLAAYYVLATLSRLPAVTEMDGDSLDQTFRETAEGSPIFDNFGFIATNGRLIASGTLRFSPTWTGDSSVFKKAIAARGFVDGGYAVDPDSGQAVHQYALAVRNTSGTLTGVLFANAEPICCRTKSARRLETNRDAIAALADSSGTILMTSQNPEKWVGRQLTLHSAESKKAFERMKADGEGSGDATREDGTPVVYGFARITGPANSPSSYVVYFLPRQVAYGQAERDLLLNVLVALLVGGLVLAMAWMGIDRLVLRPVRSLLDASERLGQGDFSVRTDLKATDTELGRLGAAFDKMANALQLRDVQLQRSLEVFKLFMDNHPAVAYVADPDGYIVYTNRRFEDLFGTPRRSVESIIEDWAGPETGLLLQQRDQEILETGLQRTLRCTVSDTSGDEREWEFRKFRITGTDGKQYIGTIGLDLTDRERAEENSFEPGMGENPK